MISVTRLDGSEFIINADLIETIEARPDTVITFAHDKKVVVRETPQEVVVRVVEFRHQILAEPGTLISTHRPTPEQTSYMHKGQGTNRFRLLKQDETDPT